VNERVRIALDVMGGDFAPHEVIKGAVFAKKENSAIDIVLVGDKSSIEKHLSSFGEKDSFSVEHSSEVITMDDSPVSSVKRKKDSSIVKGVSLVRERKVEAFVSAGNTGAVVSASILYLGLLEGVQRPGIAIIIPTLTGSSLLIDVGANINPRPIHLLQYAIMAETYFRLILEKSNVKVGLLNIGEEETKGTDFMKECYKLLEASTLNFRGNIEPKDIFSGKCDVIICDGIVGNVALKVSEGLVETAGLFFNNILNSSMLAKAGALLLKPYLKKFSRMMDYAEYGGAPLLGVDGIVVIAHGRSDARAIKNALKFAGEEVKRNLNQLILESVNA